MRLIGSIFAALLGSAFGAAARLGVEIAEAQVKREPVSGPVMVGGSFTAGLVGGLIGSIFGLRRAFWLGAVLGAAGASRVDALLFSRYGLDPETLMAKASEAANRAKTAAKERAAEMESRMEAAVDAAAEAGDADAG